MEYTPENKNCLKANKVFVFGNNLAGYHGSGAARVAMNQFEPSGGRRRNAWAILRNSHKAGRLGVN